MSHKRNSSVVQQAPQSPRESEYRLFSEITRELMSVGASDRASEAFRNAIERNRSLWTALRADLESESNWLARDLKARLISLALWVDRHSELVLDSQAEVGPLIAVNSTIMEGLVN